MLWMAKVVHHLTMFQLISIAQQSSGYGWLAPAVFAACMFVGLLTFVPRNLFSLTAGFLFGWTALPVVIIASMASMAFGSLICRWLLKRRATHWCGHRIRFVLTAIDRNGWHIIALLALAGPIPTTGQTIIYGLSDKPIGRVVLLVALAQLPQTLLFIGLGTLGHSVSVETTTPIKYAIMAATVLCSAAIVVFITRQARAALAKNEI